MGTRKVTGFRRWAPAVIIGVVGLAFLGIQLIRVIDKLDDSASADPGPMIAGIAIAVVITAAVVWWFVHRSRAHRVQVAEAFPDAYRLELATTAELAAAASALGGERIPVNRTGTLVVAHGTLRVYVGGVDVPRIDVPVERVLEVGTGEVRSGMYWLPSVEVIVTSEAGPVELSLLPTQKSLVRPVGRAEVAAIAERLRAELDAAARPA
ncbi:hypothetical protein ACWEOH_09690 [Agromyces sp. NPDC004153]